MNANKFFVLVAMGFGCVPRIFAQTWTQTSAPALNWQSIACSADGTRLAAVNCISPAPQVSEVPIYFSTNSGTTWIPADDSGISYEVGWQSVVSSANGANLFVGGQNGLLASLTNSGVNWNITWPLGQYGSWAAPNSLIGSADGETLVGITGSGVSVSSDAGNTWTSYGTSIGYGNLTCLGASADGTKLVAGSFYNSVYTSSDSGVTWNTTGPAFELQWGAVASSVDGNKLVAATFTSSTVYTNGSYESVGGPIYSSADAGLTWTQTTAPSLSWQSMASSADGTVLIAAASPGPIYTSTNCGEDWLPADAPCTNWNSVACSADGKKLYAVASGGGIWTFQTAPAPQLNINVTNGANLAWIIPSTNFVLQQSADLASWSAVTNVPVLNLTNLQNQVVLPLSDGSAFFRLATP
jgi:hypothetical protein